MPLFLDRLPTICGSPVIRHALTGSGPPAAPASRPRSSSPCFAVSRCRAAVPDPRLHRPHMGHPAAPHPGFVRKQNRHSHRAGSHMDEQPSDSPDPAGRPEETSPRSRTDLNASGRPRGYLRICECVVSAVLDGLPPGSVPAIRVTRYGSSDGRSTRDIGWAEAGRSAAALIALRMARMPSRIALCVSQPYVGLVTVAGQERAETAPSAQPAALRFSRSGVSRHAYPGLSKTAGCRACGLPDARRRSAPVKSAPDTSPACVYPHARDRARAALAPSGRRGRGIGRHHHDVVHIRRLDQWVQQVPLRRPVGYLLPGDG